MKDLAGLSILCGLLVVAGEAGPFGVVILIGLAIWLWRRG